MCRDRVPEHVRDKVRVEAEVGERHLTIVECRPPLAGTTGRDPTAGRSPFRKDQGSSQVIYQHL
ncbi:DUF3024 domain-containing protein [Mycobacterium asiaticum]|uniref:DUF3024 domain-containing protein n=1 Tax=Mycobacterium asiaticum TaxID=1790 RepID=UPI003F50F4A2